MDYYEEIDWLKATIDQRKLLYKVARGIADTGIITVEEILFEAVGPSLQMGTDYVSSFRAGKIKRSYAALVHAWLGEHYLFQSRKIMPELFPMPHTDAWQEYVKAHAIRGQLHILKIGDGLDMVQRSRHKQKPDSILKIGDDFCFRLNSDATGYAVAFVIYSGQMTLLPLGPNEEQTVTIKEGRQLFPLDEDGHLDPLAEEINLGPHTFIISVASERSDLPTLTRLLKPDDQVQTHAVRVEFTAS
ncbi:MAG TPA: hypothetical protein DCS30_14030 [Rhizobiales bacterium]|nr:hypothetical protein [Hyphomicrobiales bacterium]